MSWVSDGAFLPGSHLLEQSPSARSQLPEAVPLRQATAWRRLLEQLMISNMCWLHDLQSGNSSPAGGEIIACSSARPLLTSLVCSLKHLSFDLNRSIPVPRFFVGEKPLPHHTILPGLNGKVSASSRGTGSAHLLRPCGEPTGTSVPGSVLPSLQGAPSPGVAGTNLPPLASSSVAQQSQGGSPHPWGSATLHLVAVAGAWETGDCR